MKSNGCLACCLAVALAGAASAQGTTYAVTNYSWLQLPDNVALVGSSALDADTALGAAYTGHSPQESVLLGDMQPWIPNHALTRNGTNDYWVTLDFGAPRGMDTVRVGYWAGEGTAIRRLRFFGSNDGEAFTALGVCDLGQDTTGTATIQQALDGNAYRYLRVRLNGEGSQPDDPDYRANAARADRGGPGFQWIEPYGDGTLSFEEANVANATVFGAVASCSPGLEFAWNGFNNGVLEDGARAGEESPWDEGRYLEIDLGAVRNIYRAILVADDNWRPASATFEVSGDGASFVPVELQSAPTLRGSATGGTLEYVFHPVEARYWRIASMTGGSYMLLNQWMLYQTENHAPAVAATNATVHITAQGYAAPAMADVDAGSSDPDGDTLSATFSPAKFFYADAGTTQSVVYTVSDGVFESSTNLEIVVLLDPSLGKKIPVADYSWLQIPQGLAATVGNPATPFSADNPTSHGAVDVFRWGSRCWIPTGDLSQYGAGDYWGTLELDEPRNVKQVRVQLWSSGSHKVRRFAIEGSTDGETFAAIGAHDFGSFQTADSVLALVDVAPGVYRYIRVRFNGTASGGADPDYTTDGGVYGGPGLTLIEPIGDGAIRQEFVNFANRDAFGTVFSCVCDRSGTQLNNGTLQDCHWLIGEDYPWDEGHYLQFDLGEARPVYRTILKACREYGPQASASFAWSNDGVTFTPVAGATGPDFHAVVPGPSHGALEYSFPPVEARYWRVVGATGGNYAIFTQWMLYASDNQAPVVSAVSAKTFYVGAGGSSLAPEDVDTGSYDPDGDELVKTLTPSTFTFSQVGTTVDVVYSVSDGLVATTVVIPVAVKADPSLGGRIPVAGYNWLQLPGDDVAVAGVILDADGAPCSLPWSGYGAPSYLRWGYHVWIIHGAGNGCGTALTDAAVDPGTGWYIGQTNYAGVVTLAAPRNVSKVNVQLWASEGASFKRFFLDGSADGTNWTPCATFESETAVTGTPVYTYNVPSALYKAFRVRFMAGDYTGGHAGRGGPGIYCIQPCGDGLVEPNEVNWANAGNFGAVLGYSGINHAPGLNANGNGNLAGDFLWGDGGRVGTISRGFEEGDYIQVDLGYARWLRSMTILWNYIGGDLALQGSRDGETFEAIAFTRDDPLFPRASNLDFDGMGKYRYIRIVDGTNTATGHFLVNQILLMGAEPPKGTMLMIR
ncbi:MAG: discoidin domain-containing protein [Kiritimatiellia bacterium]|jgi:hypothetical protein